MLSSSFSRRSAALEADDAIGAFPTALFSKRWLRELQETEMSGRCSTKNNTHTVGWGRARPVELVRYLIAYITYSDR